MPPVPAQTRTSGLIVNMQQKYNICYVVIRSSFPESSSNTCTRNMAEGTLFNILPRELKERVSVQENEALMANLTIFPFVVDISTYSTKGAEH